MKEPGAGLSLETNPESKFLPAVAGFVEESARIFGLGYDDALKLTLASEEIFVYVCNVAKTKHPISIQVRSGVYYVQVTFLFPAGHFDLQVFNITALMTASEEENHRELGLLIASESVERLLMYYENQKDIKLVLVKDKTYPAYVGTAPVAARVLRHITVAVPDEGEVKLFVRYLQAYYAAWLYPECLHFPGKLIDMATSGDYGLIIAKDGENIGGGLLWKMHTSTRMVEFAGPYIFAQPGQTGVAEKLIETLIERMGKSDVLCLLSFLPTPEFPRGYFELLGTVEMNLPGGSKRSWPTYYRQMKEDYGCRVWVHPGIEEYLRTEYGRLVLARDITVVSHEGERRPPNSVFMIEYYRLLTGVPNVAFLKAVLDGDDAPENIVAHLDALGGKGIGNIFFNIDLGVPWQASLVPPLLESGFVPCLVIPHGGEADVLTFQYRKGA
jgi:anti-sigma regulatory factor (Ser/Thr protein kinase)